MKGFALLLIFHVLATTAGQNNSGESYLTSVREN